MNILQISTSDLGGGAEGSAWNLFQVYRERGHNSWLAVGYKRSDDKNVFEIPRLKPGVPWAHLCWVLHGRLSPWEDKIPGIRSLRGQLRVLAGGRAEIERQRGYEDFNYPGTRKLLSLTPEHPDIVHAHNLHGGYFDLRFLAHLSRQIPMILNLRDMWLLTGHCAHPNGCQRWKIGCGTCPDLNIYPAIQRDATAFNWQRKRQIYARGRFYVTTVSEWLMQQVKDSMLCGIQCRVVKNAINLGIFTPGDRLEARMRLGLPKDFGIVLFTAHNPFKDYEMMKATLNQLQMIKNPLLFICLGKQEEPFVLGQGKMIYPGFEHDPVRMALYYRAADVFIHAAKGEAFGKTIAEAMACGTPVVATAVDAIPELIEDGVTGFLVDRGDSATMAARVQQLLIDAKLKESMGARAAAIAWQQFNLDRQVNEFLAWYEEILTRTDRKMSSASRR